MLPDNHCMRVHGICQRSGLVCIGCGVMCRSWLCRRHGYPCSNTAEHASLIVGWIHRNPHPTEKRSRRKRVHARLPDNSLGRDLPSSSAPSICMAVHAGYFCERIKSPTSSDLGAENHTTFSYAGHHTITCVACSTGVPADQDFHLVHLSRRNTATSKRANSL